MRLRLLALARQHREQRRDSPCLGNGYLSLCVVPRQVGERLGRVHLRFHTHGVQEREQRCDATFLHDLTLHRGVRLRARLGSRREELCDRVCYRHLRLATVQLIKEERDGTRLEEGLLRLGVADRQVGHRVRRVQVRVLRHVTAQQPHERHHRARTDDRILLRTLLGELGDGVGRKGLRLVAARLQNLNQRRDGACIHNLHLEIGVGGCNRRERRGSVDLAAVVAIVEQIDKRLDDACSNESRRILIRLHGQTVDQVHQLLLRCRVLRCLQVLDDLRDVSQLHLAGLPLELPIAAAHGCTLEARPQFGSPSGRRALCRALRQHQSRAGDAFIPKSKLESLLYCLIGPAIPSSMKKHRTQERKTYAGACPGRGVTK